MPDETELTGGGAGESWWDEETVGAVSSFDTLFRALATPTRRRVLVYLLEREEATFEELTDVLVGWAASEGAVVDPAQRERLEIGLYHDHLPLLAESGVVDYDPETNEIRLETLPEAVAELVRLVNRHEQGGAPDTE